MMKIEKYTKINRRKREKEKKVTLKMIHQVNEENNDSLFQGIKLSGRHKDVNAFK